MPNLDAESCTNGVLHPPSLPGLSMIYKLLDDRVISDATERFEGTVVLKGFKGAHEKKKKTFQIWPLKIAHNFFVADLGCVFVFYKCIGPSS